HRRDVLGRQQPPGRRRAQRWVARMAHRLGQLEGQPRRHPRSDVAATHGARWLALAGARLLSPEHTVENRTALSGIGGRKFAAFFAATLSLVALYLFGVELSEQTLDTIVAMYIAFAGGNGLEHIASRL